MKIRTNTPEMLIVEHVPWGLLVGLMAWAGLWCGGAVIFILQGSFIGGLIFLLLGAAAPIAFIGWAAQRHQLVLDRATRTLEWRIKTFRGYSCQWFPLDQIERIEVRNHGPKLARICIVVGGGMDAGQHVLPHVTVKLAQVTGAVTAAQHWLAQ